jgi:hypothetical protein
MAAVCTGVPSAVCLHCRSFPPADSPFSLLFAAETLSGLGTIRAYGMEAAFASVSRARTDVNANVFLKLNLVNRCVRRAALSSSWWADCRGM